MLAGVQTSNLAVRFLAELVVIAAAGYWGFTVNAAAWLRVVAGLGAPATLIVIWGFFGAPLAPRKLTGGAHLMLDVAWFSAGVLALLAAHRPGWAVALAVVYAVNLALIIIWKQG